MLQNLDEFWATATRPSAGNGLELCITECQVRVARIKRVFHFLPDSLTLFDEWERLVITHPCQGRKSDDARLVAAMGTHGITQPLTLKTAEFVRFPGPTLIDPTAAPPAGP